MKCQECDYNRHFTEKDYIKSGWWPGLAVESTYLFAEDVLRILYLLNHENSALSLRKFVCVLIYMSKNADRESKKKSYFT